ncbi:hypothetical protein FACS189415_2480 [Bacteroidia bacterium]|nr:hypothetical protein FACS189426_04670 [Bacteroidia bacterium]GHT29104.1 hypothetical protein FACS189432_07960 [Bacteroidia bacterium]GHU82292.1 hypothetical protein FACS189415_2480 [Bacteroidia bacterium]
MKYKFRFIILFLIAFSFVNIQAQTADSTQVSSPKQLLLGGYGEAAFSRNYYSGNPFRYMNPNNYKNDPSHGRFDLPHVVFFVGYEFGNGWRLNSEIEFEHGGTESAVEIEPEEGGEYESEIERGGEVALEQFWIEKTFSKALNLRLGHIIVPIGYTNGNHLPNQFFTVYRPEGENTILPCTWHETGISLWGKFSRWRYEILLLPGLDSELFSNKRWIGGASASPYEFKTANKYAGAVRIDNYSVPGLRIGVSGYYGESFANSITPSYAEKYKNVKGVVSIGSVDFEYNAHNWIARGSFDYGHLSDAKTISLYNRNLPNQSTSPRSNIASDAISGGVEAGYDIFSQVSKFHAKQQKLYIFGRYEQYDSMYKTDESIQDEQWCGRQRLAFGLNYFPMREIVVKAEYSKGLLKQPFANEPSVSLGIAYTGFFNM